jgi:hypothetical protein
MAGRVVRESSDPTWIRSLSTRGSFFQEKERGGVVHGCHRDTVRQKQKATSDSVPKSWDDCERTSCLGDGCAMVVEDMQRGFIGEPSRGLEAASSDSSSLLGSAPASQLVPGGHG